VHEDDAQPGRRPVVAAATRASRPARDYLLQATAGWEGPGDVCMCLTGDGATMGHAYAGTAMVCAALAGR